ncbi:MAG: hypothetical protein U0797_22895 [Gemmataceae bacterium]
MAELRRKWGLVAVSVLFLMSLAGCGGRAGYYYTTEKYRTGDREEVRVVIHSADGKPIFTERVPLASGPAKGESLGDNGEKRRFVQEYFHRDGEQKQLVVMRRHQVWSGGGKAVLYLVLLDDKVQTLDYLGQRLSPKP